METTPLLYELLEEAAAADVRLHFLPAKISIEFRDVWRSAGRAARWMANTLGTGAPVAMVLDSSPEALIALFGAWRSGRRVVSVPNPPRGSSLDSYQAFVERSCAAADATALLVAAEYLPFLPPLPFEVFSFESVAAAATDGAPIDDPHSAELVQFTSGSTADPKGVVLGLAEMSANVEAIIQAIEPRPGDGALSWLPFSHDMGLIGMVLTAISAAGTRYANGADLVYIKPEAFIRRPNLWLTTCSEFRTTITAAPDFGFSHATRVGAGQVDDLSSLRLCITGAEPVRVSTLRSFRDTFAPVGFDELSFSPAFGLAEAGLAVTMTRPDEMWRSLAVDADALGERRVVESDDGIELVSAGRPLDGYDIRTGPGVGRLGITGPSLLRQYLPGSEQTEPWFETNDLGFVRDGELYVAGRIDDVIQLAGRNVFLSDVDALVATHTGLAQGRVQAIASEAGLSVVAERTDSHETPHLAEAVRRATVATVGWSPVSVIITERGSLPRSPSGKPRRNELSRQIDEEELIVLHRLTTKA